MSAATASSTEAAILGRLIHPERADLSPEAARSILGLEFEEADRDRMHELAQRAQAGTLSDAELSELDAYRRVGRLFEVMRSKARRSLKRAEGAG